MQECLYEKTHKQSDNKPKAGTQHTTVEADGYDGKSIPEITLESDVFPSRDALLNAMGYQGMNLSEESTDDRAYAEA